MVTYEMAEEEEKQENEKNERVKGNFHFLMVDRINAFHVSYRLSELFPSALSPHTSAVPVLSPKCRYRSPTPVSQPAICSSQNNLLSEVHMAHSIVSLDIYSSFMILVVTISNFSQL